MGIAIQGDRSDVAIGVYELGDGCAALTLDQHFTLIAHGNPAQAVREPQLFRHLVACQQLAIQRQPQHPGYHRGDIQHQDAGSSDLQVTDPYHLVISEVDRVERLAFGAVMEEAVAGCVSDPETLIRRNRKGGRAPG